MALRPTQQPVHRRERAARGKYAILDEARIETEMAHEDSLEQALVGIRRQDVAAFVELAQTWWTVTPIEAVVSDALFACRGNTIMQK